jgi:hypothetical protein|tara:strand:+ start:943 stop:1173 length:231 start_codon:yes stop_codon:yes gene_type:complete
MWSPSLDPGGVSSPAEAEADALAEAEADCEADSCGDGAYRPDQPLERLEVKGFVYETVAEPSLLSELAEAEILELC